MFLRLLHILLAINVLLSATGVPVYVHSCQKMGNSLSFFHSPKSCCAKKSGAKSCCAAPSKPKPSGECLSKNPCCHDYAAFAKSENDAAKMEAQKLSNTAPAPALAELVAPEFSPIFFPLADRKTRQFQRYLPPPQQPLDPAWLRVFRC